jgi:hypothetical protein
VKEADADKYRVSGRTLENRRKADIAFLEEIRSPTLTLERVRELARNHSHKKSPEWKRVAIARALIRLEKHATT